MNNFNRFFVSVAFAVLPFQNLMAEDLAAILKKVQDLSAAQNYTKALEELTWARKELEKQNIDRIRAFLPDTVAGYQGEKLQDQSALGLTNLTRRYKKGESEFEVSLTGGSPGGAGLGDLAAFGRMAAMAQGGQNTFRIGGKTASLNERDSSDRGELSVFLDSGLILKIESEGGVTHEALKEIANAIKIEDLDKYLKGS